MRLSEENTRRLNRAIWWGRIRAISVATLALVALAVPLVYLSDRAAQKADPFVAQQRLHGIIVAARPDGARGNYAVSVRLDDGSTVAAKSRLSVIPVPGADVTLSDGVHASGRHDYLIIKVGN